MRRTGWRVALAVVLLAAAAACYVVAAGSHHGTLIAFVTWLGGVVLGTAGVYVLIVAFPLAEVDTSVPDPEE